MGSVSVRYIVNDVDAAIEFYTRMLDFEMEIPSSRVCYLVTRRFSAIPHKT